MIGAKGVGFLCKKIVPPSNANIVIRGGNPTQGSEFAYTTTSEKYNTVTDSFTSALAMSVGTMQHFGGGNNLYLKTAGGVVSPGAYTATAVRYTHSNNTQASTTAILANTRFSASAGNANLWLQFGGQESGTTTVDKAYRTSWATDSSNTAMQVMSVTARTGAAACNDSHALMYSGYEQGTNAKITARQLYNLSADTRSATTQAAWQGYNTGTTSDTHGYFFSGNDDASVHKYEWSSSTVNATTSLSTKRGFYACASSLTHGYLMGGYSSIYATMLGSVLRYAYATDTPATASASLSVSRGLGIAGSDNSFFGAA